MFFKYSFDADSDLIFKKNNRFSWLQFKDGPIAYVNPKEQLVLDYILVSSVDYLDQC